MPSVPRAFTDLGEVGVHFVQFVRELCAKPLGVAWWTHVRDASCALQQALLLATLVAVFCYVAGKVTGNKSWVDRLWSLVPAAYALLAWRTTWTADGGVLADVRTSFMTALVCAWSARLTFNYARKGGYAAGSEDYRWVHVRSMIGSGARWEAFELLFIAVYQNALLVAITFPLFDVATSAQVPHAWTPIDTLAAVWTVAALVGETVCDEQQWRFHARKATDRSLTFCRDGVFAYSRHLNVFCEYSLWIGMYVFTLHKAEFTSTAALLDVNTWLNWSVVGCVNLYLVIHFSTNLTERISVAKYGAAYVQYQRRVPRECPFTWGNLMNVLFRNDAADAADAAAAAAKPSRKITPSVKVTPIDDSDNGEHDDSTNTGAAAATATAPRRVPAPKKARATSPTRRASPAKSAKTGAAGTPRSSSPSRSRKGKLVADSVASPSLAAPPGSPAYNVRHSPRKAAVSPTRRR